MLIKEQLKIWLEYLVYWVTSSQTILQLINVISSGLPTVLDFLKHKYLLCCIFFFIHHRFIYICNISNMSGSRPVNATGYFTRFFSLLNCANICATLRIKCIVHTLLCYILITKIINVKWCKHDLWKILFLTKMVWFLFGYLLLIACEFAVSGREQYSPTVYWHFLMKIQKV